MKRTVFAGRIVLPLLIVSATFIFLACQKTEEVQTVDEEIASTRKPNPPSSQPLYFNNCGSPNISGTFVMGTPANVIVTLNYVNGSGASYSSFTSTTVNGIIMTAPAGTLNRGAGSIRFTARGTPIAAGYFLIPVSIAGGTKCNLPVTVVNAGVTESTGDPGPVAGSTGTVSFTYQNQPVIYETVRAADGKIWIRQNLGSPRVSLNSIDEASYGHVFQWGRWDDGHQVPTSSVITGSAALQNPSQIAPGNPAFIKSQVLNAAWWGVGGLSTDTWSGNLPTAVNGKDPCAALGAGWRMPLAADWQNIINLESISDTYTAFRSNLKLPAGSYRIPQTGIVGQSGDVGRFWTGTPEGGSAVAVFIDNAYGLFISPTERGLGLPCRCVKD
ncbi:MAG: hypothetical protein H7Y42_08380 [Chitinophagaceae bacterium]|nr:hypothetical protein [Chitinophagaceae bacterium]